MTPDGVRATGWLDGQVLARHGNDRAEGSTPARTSLAGAGSSAYG
jgi:hypothetical protein